MEDTPGRASLEKLGCRTPPQLHAGGVGRQQQHHMVEANSSTGLVMALYVASMVSLCLPHFAEVRILRMLIVLRALVAVKSMCLL